jgi:hypothetical protein
MNENKFTKYTFGLFIRCIGFLRRNSDEHKDIHCWKTPNVSLWIGREQWEVEGVKKFDPVLHAKLMKVETAMQDVLDHVERMSDTHRS